MSAFKEQVGGGHYKKMAIQPAEFCHANGICKLEGDVIYYVARWREKNGVEDLRKARHTLDLLIELEERKAAKEREEKMASGARFVSMTVTGTATPGSGVVEAPL